MTELSPGDPSTPRAFVHGLIARWKALEAARASTVDRAGRDAWARELAAHGRRLLDRARNPPELERFRSRVMADRQAFEARVVARVMARWEGLGEDSRHWLALFETEPDLLGPFDFLRAETVHTRLLAWAFRGARRPQGLGPGALQAFLGVLAARGCALASEALERGQGEVQVTPERSVPPYGRVDLWLAFPGLGDLAIEVKVDHVEREDQVADYRTAIKACGCTDDRRGSTIFLTADGGECSDGGATLVRFEDLLRAWIPVAGQGQTGEHAYFRAYLKSIASGLCDLGGSGRFDEWHWVRQGRTLDFIGRGR